MLIKIKNNKDVNIIFSVFGYKSETMSRAVFWRAAALSTYIVKNCGRKALQSEEDCIAAIQEILEKHINKEMDVTPFFLMSVLNHKSLENLKKNGPKTVYAAKDEKFNSTCFAILGLGEPYSEEYSYRIDGLWSNNNDELVLSLNDRQPNPSIVGTINLMRCMFGSKWKDINANSFHYSMLMYLADTLYVFCGKTACATTEKCADSIQSVLQKHVDGEIHLDDMFIDLVLNKKSLDNLNIPGPKQVSVYKNPSTNAYCFAVLKLREEDSDEYLYTVDMLWSEDGLNEIAQNADKYVQGAVGATQRIEAAKGDSVTQCLQIIEEYSKMCPKAVAQELGNDKPMMAVFAMYYSLVSAGKATSELMQGATNAVNEASKSLSEQLGNTVVNPALQKRVQSILKKNNVSLPDDALLALVSEVQKTHTNAESNEQLEAAVMGEISKHVKQPDNKIKWV